MDVNTWYSVQNQANDYFLDTTGNTSTAPIILSNKGALWQFLPSNSSTSGYSIRAKGPDLCLDIGTAGPWTLNECAKSTTWLINPYANNVGDSGFLMLTTSQSRYLGAVGVSERELDAPTAIPAVGKESNVLWSFIPAGRVDNSTLTTVPTQAPTSLPTSSSSSPFVTSNSPPTTPASPSTTSTSQSTTSTVPAATATASPMSPSNGGTVTPAPGVASSTFSRDMWIIWSAACSLSAVLLLL